MDRKKAIECLQYIIDMTNDGVAFSLDSDDIEAIRMGLNSLKVDELYQLEYEKSEQGE